MSVLTGQTIHLVGMLTCLYHCRQDRSFNQISRYMRRAAQNLGHNLEIKRGGLLDTRAASILDDTLKLLREVNEKGLFAAITEGVFAGVKRLRTGGKGREGVFKKSRWYFNPVEEDLRAGLSDRSQAPGPIQD